jgi:hypothetical protein
MGMHFGILVAELSWEKFFPLLSALTGHFVPEGPVENLDELELDSTPEGHPVVGGELDGRSYVLDTSFMMSMTGADFVVELSRRANTLVIGCGAETTSGSYSFLAARSGRVLRHYFDCQAFLAEPLDEGEPAATEDDLPLEDLDGKGLTAALACFGFDFDSWYNGGQREKYLYTVEELKSDEERGVRIKGPLADRLDEHYAEFALAEDERPSIMLYTRDAVTGQIVSTQDTGLRFGDEEISNPEFWNRFWNRLAN